MSGRTESALQVTGLSLLCQFLVATVGVASAQAPDAVSKDVSSAVQSGGGDSGGQAREIYNSAQAERGKTVYAAKCASCHLDSLAGSSTAPSLAGGRFVQAWEARTLRELFGRLRTTMPADDPGSLEENETVDLIAYLLSSNKYPAGAAELKPDRQRMEAIRIGRPD